MEQKWLKIDMHMHSYYSSKNKKGDCDKVKEMKAEEFVGILVDANVNIFSITDHNYFSKEFYDEIDKYIENKKLNIRIVNGVEFDVNVDLNDKNSYIHVCIYFDDNVDRQKLQEMIDELYKNEDLKPSFSQILEKLNALNTKYIIIPHGDKERGLFNKNLINKLNVESQPEFYKYAMYKIFNAFDVKEKFYKESINFWATNFFEKTKKFDELFKNKSNEEIKLIEGNISKKIRDKSFALNEEDNYIYDYIMEYGSYYAYFSFSDWHNALPYNPIMNNFIFGSLDTAFSSFEMSTLDPVSRIICTKETSISIPDTLLKSISFQIGNDTKKVYFTPGLNAIVGKRGSGKSLLISIIRNLAKADDSMGALKIYKGLNISNIKGENRGKIPISLGALNSIAFLSQNDIKEIFEEPAKAQEKIYKNFIEIKKIDVTKLQEIVSIGEKIAPYNNNYKNLTSNILSLKKSNSFLYKKTNNIESKCLDEGFEHALTAINNLINSVTNVGLNTAALNDIYENLKFEKEKYNRLLKEYAEIVNNLNESIEQINKTRTNNQIMQNQNRNAIKSSLEQIYNNFLIKLNVEKMKFLLKNFKMDNPKVELNKKGKYLFVTYYEIPSNINEILIEKILEALTYANCIEDIDNFVQGNGKIKLKSKEMNIVQELKKLLGGNIFKPKNEFYEIVDMNIDYKNEIKSLSDLEKYLNNNSLKNLSKASLGTQSVAYLDMLFDLEETILVLDQPEDNIDNDYISNYLVPNIKEKKKIKQLIFVTHNPSVAVYGDAFNYIYVENNGTINYKNYLIEKPEDKERLIKILEGGKKSFANRNHKFGDIIGEEEYGN